MKLHIPDMTCGHCVASVTQAIKTLQADVDVVCDLAHHTVHVADMGKLTPARVIAALDEVGFEATLLEGQA